MSSRHQFQIGIIHMGRPLFPSEEQDRFIVRMPAGMRDKLKSAAADNNRSMNAEIVSRLERYPSLGGEVDAMWGVARALADEIDKVAGPEFAEEPLFDKVSDAFTAVDADTGEVDRVKLEREFAAEAQRRLAHAGGKVEEPVFNFVLDAKGYPLSWPEIAAHVYRTAKAAGLKQISSRTAVFNATTEKGDEKFFADYARLIRWYQKQTREQRDYIRSDSEADRDLADDVRAVIAMIDEELAGKTVGPELEMKSDLGNKLSDAITERTKLGMEIVADMLLAQGHISKERREEMQTEIDSALRPAA